MEDLGDRRTATVGGTLGPSIDISPLPLRAMLWCSDGPSSFSPGTLYQTPARPPVKVTAVFHDPNALGVIPDPDTLSVWFHEKCLANCVPGDV